MKLTKKLESEILKVYNTYWDCYLKGDVKTMASLLVDEYQQVGSAESEVFFNKKDAVKFLHDTIDQVAGKLQMRKRNIKLEQQDNLFLVHELCDVYALDGKNWIFYAKFRASTLMQKKRENWKIIHQHTSFPDTRADTGENIAIEKIAEENLQLREAVKRRTVELEDKNRELEIETALEKVRAIAMGMYKPDDMVDICKSISLQLQSLGLKDIRNVQTAIFYPGRGTYMNFEYYARHGKIFITEVDYTNHKIGKAFAAKMLKGKGQVSITYIRDEKKVKEWLAFQKKTNVFIDRHLEKASSLTYYWHSLGPVALGISTYSPLNKEELNLFNRFLNVFELAYTRYLDIEQAISQAREAKIEASLEKVRAVALGMKKSEDLLAICKIQFEELKKLGFGELRNALIGIYHDKEGFMVDYDYSDFSSGHITKIPYDKNAIVDRSLKQLKSAKDAFTEFVVEGKELKQWKAFRKKNGEYDDTRLNNLKAIYYYFYSIGKGNNGISVFKKIGEDQLEILKRFRNVFDFAYRRYLDVAKAEAQAKEAQVELALERVRARTMAMHESGELAETAAVLFQQITELGIETWTSGFNIWQEDDTSFTGYNPSPEGGITIPYQIPSTGDPFFKKIYNAKKKETVFLVYESAGESLAATYRYMKTLPVVKEVLKGIEEAGFALPTRQINHCVFFKHGFLLFITLEPYPPAHDIFVRFGKVFEQTYTRFLDLQRAEAQAREAQIEFSLERVRARALAMHKSEELVSAADIVFQEMKNLGIESLRAGIGIMDPLTETVEIWSRSELSDNRSENSILGKVPAKNHPFWSDYYKAWKQKKVFFVDEFVGADVKKFYEFNAEFLSYPKRKGFNPRETVSGFFFPEGALNVVSSRALTTDQCNIMVRFAKAFGLTYKRFLDLQKAEAQAKEAQIEGALERVRSRTMAMHQTSELQKVIHTLHSELLNLNLSVDGGSFVVINEDIGPGLRCWGSGGTADTSEEVQVPDFNMPFCTNLVKGIKKGPGFFTEEFSQQEKQQYFTQLFKHKPWSQLSPKQKKQTLSGLGGYTRSVAVSKHTSIFIINHHGKKFSGADNEILRRFATVFEQTYTRFLDLHKAEAQTRESKIEAALERMRAAAMSMQRTEDIINVCEAMYSQLSLLGFDNIRNAQIAINNEVNQTYTGFEYSYRGIGANMKEVPYDVNPLMREIVEQMKKAGDTLFSKQIAGKEFNQWKRWRKSLSATNAPDDARFEKATSMCFYLYAVEAGTLGISTFGAVSDEQLEILKRFKNVFELSYRRFDDLKKAEAQAREALIETALEKVRSRSLAMHHSDELKEVIIEVLRKLQELGIAMESRSAIICLYKEGEKEFEQWVASPEHTSAHSVLATYFNSVIHGDIWKARNNGTDFYAKSYTVKEKNAMFRYFFDHTELRSMPENEKKWLLEREYYELAIAFEKHSAVLIANFTADLLDSGVHQILKRFAKVFEQAYIRFLDLQKAEAQAREAKIEMALERVRSRSLAMHSSGELGEVVTVVLNNLLELGYMIDQGAAAHLAIFSEDTKDFFQWSADPALPHPVRSFIPYTDLPILTEFWDARQKGHDFFANVYSFDEKNTWFKFAFEHSDLKHIPGELKKLLLESETYAHSIAIEKNSAIIINSITGNQLSKNQIDILKRFSKVFEQAYVRFLDLQKAEAQAREAQIEAALEKVRSHSMGMQKSEDLKEVIQVVYDQFVQLNIPVEHTGFVMDYKTRDDHFIWIADKHGAPSRVTIPSFDCVYYNRFKEAKEKGEDFFVTNLSFEEKNTFYQQLFEYVPGLTEEARKFYFGCPGLSASTVLLENIGLYIENFSGIPFTEEDNSILMRFGKVFQQTYTRFLDLQKAEAQAREAQIEVALERVRARAMAMHSSQELPEVAMELRQQMGILGQKYLEVCAIHLYEEDQDFFESWGAMRPPGSADKIFQGAARFPKSGPAIINEMMQLRAAGEADYVLVNEKEKAIEWFDVLKQHAPEAYAALIYSLRGIPVEELVAYWSISDFSGGALLMVTHSYPDESSRNLLRRAANVFDLAYRRFRDLKKAEAQAREAQIELGLERVRARAMAMQRSEELKELIGTVFTELTKLDLVLTRCVIMIYNGEENNSRWWMANSEDPKNPAGFFIKQHEHPPSVAYFNAWDERKLKFTYPLQGKVKEDWDDFLFSETELKYLPGFVIEGMRAPGLVYLNASFNNFGNLTLASLEPLSDEHFDILLRFAKVFDLTYTRFNDLQKAEAQAREARIETALEKVRSRTMGMQQSHELGEVATVLFKELNQLVENLWSCGFVLCKKDRGEDEWWLSTGNGFIPAFYLPNSGDATHANIYDAWKRGETYHTEQLEGEALQEHYDWLMNNPVSRNIFDEMKAAGHSLPNWQKLHCAYFSYGYLVMITQVPCPEEQLFKRFAQVFDQTYTRFLDLQRAEAQAKEARIEAALEKVRSRSLAMHRSEELQEVVTTVLEKLNELDIQADAINLDIFNENKKDAYLWTAVPGHQYSKEFYIPYNEAAIFKDIYEGMIGGKELHSKVYSRESKDKFLDHIFTHTDFRYIPQERKDMLYATDASTVSVAYAKNTAIIAQRYRDHPFSDEENEVLKRFAKVFEQSYIRFKDLQKAEAQAREAQIQLALERVRARTMAMQKSDELPESANLLFNQVQSLGMPAWSAGYCTWDNEKKSSITLSMSSEGVLQPSLSMPLTEDPSLMHFREAWERGESFFVEEVGGEELKKHYAYLRTLPGVKETLDDIEKAGFPVPTFQIFHLAYFSKGFLLFITYEPVPAAHDIFRRFANVFEQTFTRFLDLKKAEAQARESQVQLALERVRARTMAMQKSDELPETSLLLFQQVQGLGITAVQNSIGIVNEKEGFVELSTTVQGHLLPHTLHVPVDDPYVMVKAVAAWKAKLKSLKLEFAGQELKEYNEHRNHFFETKINFPEDQWIVHIIFFSKGWLSFSTERNISDESVELLQRFAAVFEQTYTRFNDLKQAEAQAREAKIEMALERVRSRTMAMHKSDELAETATVLFEQFNELGESPERIAIGIVNEEENMIETWATMHGGRLMDRVFKFTIDEPHVMQKMYLAWKKKEKNITIDLHGKALDEYFEFLQQSGAPVRREVFGERRIQNVAFFSKGMLTIITPELRPAETIELLKRFAGVFDLTYTRFLDLQKAEAQAKEAQIEAALEKVRSRTMAMQSSNELQETAAVLFNEFKKLGTDNIYQVTIGIYNEEEGLMDFRVTSWAGNGVQEDRSFNLDMNEPTVLHPTVSAWKANKRSLVIDLSGEKLERWLNYRNQMSGIMVKSADTEGRRVISIAFYSKGHLSISTPVPVPGETLRTLERFAAVFDATYTRFLDLQKAEEQRREAQIEASLERVRSKTMAMHNSQDVALTVATMFDELIKLNIDNSIRCGIGILDDSTTMELWTASSDHEGEVTLNKGKLDIRIHPLLMTVHQAWKDKAPGFSYELKGQDLVEYYTALSNAPDYQFHMDASKLPDRLQVSEFFFADGTLYAFTKEELPAESAGVLKRFAAVFGQTYRRYLDLLKAEAQAKEAQVEAALERVRSRTLAMQKSEELAETASELFKQLMGLGIEPNRLYIGIVNADTKDMEMWATDEQGTGVGKRFTFNASDNSSVQKLYDGWIAKKKSLSVDMHGEELQHYIKYLQQLEIPLSHALTQKRRVQSVAYFDKGFIGMASPDEQATGSIHLLERFAAVFNLTFTRFNDLKIAEAHAEQAELDLVAIKEAKQKAEEAFTELQATQKQLVQSEKMASLGELTAGIAHEIQNPLNFVNNFSEVSNELLDEMMEEVSKGNYEEVKAIVYDVKKNLEKINHHGKRADGIVKGMLQHSRSSSGQKEPTDINALADEYLRLAYHGLRAKDKSFNAIMKTDFDQAIDTVNIIPQDIGRVILNLITNAFYAVAEKKKQMVEGYEPTVSVNTKKEGDKVLISVKDNGNGIPQKVVEKIFQPFFTTKPTGQGTGLGLSLSYDIVKAHGGDIKVETREGEGSEFTIQLQAT